VPQDADAIPTCLASSQFTGPLDDISTRWISRNSGTSFSGSPDGNGSPGRDGLVLIKPILWVATGIVGPETKEWAFSKQPMSSTFVA
jgi:hypothetical protein